MKSASERVIVIKGDRNKWYNQAIFFVDKDTPATEMPVDFVAEAERIIREYAAEMPKESKQADVNKPRKKRGGFDFLLNMAMVLAGMVIIVVLLFGVLG